MIEHSSGGKSSAFGFGGWQKAVIVVEAYFKPIPP